MIVRIKHVWYQDKRYDLGKSPDSMDVQEFLHDLRAVVQFAGVCDVRLVKGDKAAFLDKLRADYAADRD